MIWRRFPIRPCYLCLWLLQGFGGKLHFQGVLDFSFLVLSFCHIASPINDFIWLHISSIQSKRLCYHPKLKWISLIFKYILPYRLDFRKKNKLTKSDVLIHRIFNVLYLAQMQRLEVNHTPRPMTHYGSRRWMPSWVYCPSVRSLMYVPPKHTRSGGSMCNTRVSRSPNCCRVFYIPIQYILLFILPLLILL